MNRSLFLTIHIIGILCFAYILRKRLVPLVRAERDFRLDRPLVRAGKVLKFWLGQWKHPRYKLAGTIHILIFAGFILLVVRTFAVLIGGFNQSLAGSGLSESFAHLYEIATDYAATVVFVCMLIAAARRLVFHPARYAVPEQYGKAHTADAIFLLGLIAILMLAESFFAASNTVSQTLQGRPVVAPAALSLPWIFRKPRCPCSNYFRSQCDSLRWRV